MNQKRQLLIAMFENAYYKEYHQAQHRDFLTTIKDDMELVRYLSDYLKHVDLSHFTPHGTKGFLQQLYVVFLDIYEFLIEDKNNKEKLLITLFLKYYKHSDSLDLMNVERVFLAPEDKVMSAADSLLNLKDQEFHQVLVKILEQIDHYKGQFTYDVKELNAVNQQFLSMLAKCS